MRKIGWPKIGFVLILFTLLFAFAGCGLIGRAGQWMESMQTDSSPSDMNEQSEPLSESMQTEETNCDPFGRADQLTELMQAEEKKIKVISGEIIRCFDEGDEEGLKSLFCEKSRSDPDFDTQVSQAFAFLKGDIQDCYIDTFAGGGQSMDNGKITEWDVSPEINDIRTYEHISLADQTDGLRFAVRTYEIDYYWKITNDEDISLVGLQYLTINYADVSEITIGEYIG